MSSALSIADLAPDCTAEIIARLDAFNDAAERAREALRRAIDACNAAAEKCRRAGDEGGGGNG